MCIRDRTHVLLPTTWSMRSAGSAATSTPARWRNAGLARAKADGKKLGRPTVGADVEARIRDASGARHGRCQSGEDVGGRISGPACGRGAGRSVTGHRSGHIRSTRPSRDLSFCCGQGLAGTPPAMVYARRVHIGARTALPQRDKPLKSHRNLDKKISGAP